MKKLLVLFIIVILFGGCSNSQKGWKTVTIPQVGSLDIPQSMVYEEDDKAIYICSDSDAKLLIGVKYENGSYTEALSEALGKEIVFEELISSEVFSNSAIIGKDKYIIDDEPCEKLFLDLYSSDKKVFFIVNDDSVSYDTITAIGKSFVMD